MLTKLRTPELKAAWYNGFLSATIAWGLGQFLASLTMWVLK